MNVRRTVLSRACRTLRLAAALLLAATLAGCSWFSFLPWVDAEDKEKDDPDEPAALVAFDAEARLERRWRAKIGRGLGRKYLRLRPAVLADRLFAADAYGTVVALNRFSGKRIWQASVGEADGRAFYQFWDRRDPAFVTGGVGAGGGRVLLGTTRGEIVALDAGDGKESWRAEVSSEVLSRPVASEDAVIAQTADGRLVALEADDGAQRWTYDSQVPLLTLRGTASPVVESGLVFAGFGDGNVGAMDARSGAPIWRQRIMLPQGRTELDRMVDVDGTPLFAGGLLLAASFQGRLKALDPRDGSVVWDVEASSFLDLAEGYGQVYMVSEDDVISAIGITSAAVAWQQEGLRNRGLTSPLAFGNYLVVGDAEGYLHVLAQSDGRFLARRKASAGLRSPLLEVDDVVYVLANDGSLEALEIERRG